MFTADNFRRIYDTENRKGVDLATRFFPSLEQHTLAVRNKAQSIRSLRKAKATLETHDFNTQLTELKAELHALKLSKSSAIDDLMHEVSQRAIKPGFKITLSKKTGPQGKPVFCIDSEPETFFIIKQLQHNIHYIYNVKQASRNDLVCQLRDMLNSKFPFELIRTDISSFYESIDRKQLTEKLDQDQLLSSTSKKYIKQIMGSYGEISNSDSGIPRGVGISAYLAELYIRPIDKAIKEIPGLIMYCRFVDDIVAIFARQNTGESLGSFRDMIINILNNNGLTHNTTKTKELNFADPTPKEFEYLGYCFKYNKGTLEISPSTAKIDKYRMRINAAFSDYWREKPVNPRAAHRKLVGRIRFLTGNTRLYNSKSCAVTGIYFNNSIATDISTLKQLDQLLKEQTQRLRSTALQRRLKKHKFTTGFEQRRYHNFSTKELQMIVKVWKYV